jgi:hypothetical protein
MAACVTDYMDLQFVQTLHNLLIVAVVDWSTPDTAKLAASGLLSERIAQYQPQSLLQQLIQASKSSIV